MNFDSFPLRIQESSITYILLRGEVEAKMLDHIQLKVRDWPRARAFYSAVLEPLGYTLFLDNATWGGFHVPGEAHGNIYVKQGTLLVCAQSAHSATSEPFAFM